ncbi:MAG: ABC transporter permease [Chloroflexi bacterium]|nr:ABC transporter permease [Chloroflexota bacterium]
MPTTSKPSPALAVNLTAPAKERSLWGTALRRLLRNRLSVFGLVIVLLFLLAAIIGPYVAPYDFLSQNIAQASRGPSVEHWFGTDPLGRDIFSRILYGARTAALVALTTTAVSLFIGVVLGTLAGFLRGRVDEFVMWITDVTMSLPGLLLAMLVNTALKRPITAWFDQMYTQTRNPAFLNTLWLDYVLVFGALALIGWAGYARLIRGQVLSIGRTLYVEAARSVGANTRRIMSRHIVPNAFGPLIVAVTQGMGGAILAESSLSFLGIGVQPPNASWGSMLADSLNLWRTFPHLMLIPAITIGVIQVAFIFLGDGLNDALNPRQSR